MSALFPVLPPVAEVFVEIRLLIAVAFPSPCRDANLSTKALSVSVKVMLTYFGFALVFCIVIPL